MTAEALHHLIVCYDIQDSSRLENAAKSAAMERLGKACDAALSAAGIPPNVVDTVERGDGALVLVGAVVPKVRILDRWLPAFHQKLQRAYERSAERSQIRLAIHAGEVHREPDRFIGADIDFTCRLVDAPIAKRILVSNPASVMAVVVSDSFYRQVVLHAAQALPRASFAEASVKVKETDTMAWVHVPGWARVPMPPPEPEASARKLDSPAPVPPGGVSISGGQVGTVGTATVHGSFNMNSGSK